MPDIQSSNPAGSVRQLPPAVSESDFLFRDVRHAGELGQDADAPAVLEVIQLWAGTVVEVCHLAQDGGPLRVGSTADADFVAPGGGESSGIRSLFDHVAGTFHAHLRSGWRCVVVADDDARAVLAPGASAWSVEIPEGAAVWIDTGDVVFAARQVPPGRRVRVPLRDRLDGVSLGLAGVVASVAALCCMVIATAPRPVETHSMDGVPTRIAMVLQAPESTSPAVHGPTPAAGEEESAGKTKRWERRGGERTSTRAQARDERLARSRMKRDRDTAHAAGLLGAMQDERVAALLDDGALRSGMFDAVGSKHAAGPGVRMGTRGLRDRQRGLGDGGRVDSIRGTGTRGVAGGHRHYGRDGADVGAKRTGVVRHPTGEFLSLGSLDAGLIDEVVKRQGSAIRYCYQRELSKDPGLAGTVVMRFTIAGDGTVAGVGVKRSSLGSETTEACIKSRIHTMQFPEPKGNGIVIVSYPFLFSAE